MIFSEEEKSVFVWYAIGKCDHNLGTGPSTFYVSLVFVVYLLLERIVYCF